MRGHKIYSFPAHLHLHFLSLLCPAMSFSHSFAKGSNGEQILQILDSIADGVSDSVGSDSAANPTLSEIQF
jgi:hypothetical protein